MLKQAEMMEETYLGVHKELNWGQRRQTKQSRVEILCDALSVSVIVQVMYCVGFSVLYAASFSSWSASSNFILSVISFVKVLLIKVLFLEFRTSI